jgi:tetratricopeptide (TPR) repeat protein
VRSLAIYEKALGKEHIAVADSLNKLVALYYTQGIYQKAEPLQVLSLAIWEKLNGKENLLVAEILNNLAFLYQAQGSYQKAEAVYLRVLAIKNKLAGKEDTDSLNNLASLYQAQGSYEKAEPLESAIAGNCGESMGQRRSIGRKKPKQFGISVPSTG